MNEAATRLYGFSREEMLAMQVIALVASGNISPLQPGVVAPTREPDGRFLTQHRRKGGAVINVDCRPFRPESRSRSNRAMVEEWPTQMDSRCMPVSASNRISAGSSNA